MKKLMNVRSWVVNRACEITTWTGIGLILLAASVIMGSSLILAILAAICGVISIIRREQT